MPFPCPSVLSLPGAEEGEGALQLNRPLLAAYLRAFREAADEFKKFQKDAYERKAQEYETRIADLKASRAQAINEGDGQRVNAIDDAIDEAKDSLKEAKQAKEIKDQVNLHRVSTIS